MEVEVAHKDLVGEKGGMKGAPGVCATPLVKLA